MCLLAIYIYKNIYSSPLPFNKEIVCLFRFKSVPCALEIRLELYQLCKLANIFFQVAAFSILDNVQIFFNLIWIKAN